MSKTISINIIQHKQESVYALRYKYDNQLIHICKKSGAKWSNSKRLWYYNASSFKVDEIISFFNGKANFNLKELTTLSLLKSKKVPLKVLLNDVQKEKMNAFYTYLKGKRFSESTLKTYVNLIAEFLIYKNNNNPITLKDIESHAENVIVSKRLSVSTHRQFISAMKHYLVFTNTNLEIDFNNLAPKKDKKLPNVLSNKEIIALIQVTKNLKHRVCIALIYSSGLRIGELINLKLQDLDLQRKIIKVSNGKGRKDRYVPIANVILPMLSNYLNAYTPKTYLIEGTEKGNKYSPNSIRQFLYKSCRLANISKNVTPHTLRHSYATHLLENGTDIRYIQVLLGHARPETTMIYTRVQSQDLQKITNPLDLIVKQFEKREKIN